MQASDSTGDRVAAREVSDFHSEPLTDPDTRRAISTLQHLFASCYGPHARPKLIHNNSGGHVTLTTSAVRLLQGMSVSRPLLRLVTTAVQQHVTLYGDCGLLAGQLCLGLVDRSLNLTVHRRLTTQVNEYLLKCCLDYLYSERCTCRVAVDFSTTVDLLKLAETAVKTKIVCGFLANDAHHVSKLIVEAFLKCFPNSCTDSSWGLTEYVGMEGRNIGDSYLVDGVLVEAPHIATYSVQSLSWICAQEGPHRGLLRVALFNTSLAGESNMSMDADYQLEPQVDFSAAVVSKLLECGRRLVTQGVGAVLCQKVVHPQLKRLWKKNGLLVLDRLGLQRTIAVHQLIGGRLLGEYQMAVEEDDLGYLQSATHRVIAHKSYIHLEAASTGSTVCTLVLCARTDEAVEELKRACKTAEQVLRSTAQQPIALTGGGCWLSHLAHFVTELFTEKWLEWSKECNCSKLQLQTIVYSFAANLKHVAMTVNKHGDCFIADSLHYHAWRVPPGVDVGSTICPTLLAKCQCGQVINNDKLVFNSSQEKPTRLDAGVNVFRSCDVLDSFLASTKALNMAVSVANMVLSIEHCIQEL